MQRFQWNASALAGIVGRSVYIQISDVVFDATSGGGGSGWGNFQIDNLAVNFATVCLL